MRTFHPKEGLIHMEEGWMLVEEGLFHPEEPLFLLWKAMMLPKEGTLFPGDRLFLPNEGPVHSEEGTALVFSRHPFQFTLRFFQTTGCSFRIRAV